MRKREVAQVLEAVVAQARLVLTAWLVQVTALAVLVLQLQFQGRL